MWCSAAVRPRPSLTFSSVVTQKVRGLGAAQNTKSPADPGSAGRDQWVQTTARPRQPSRGCNALAEGRTSTRCRGFPTSLQRTRRHTLVGQSARYRGCFERSAIHVFTEQPDERQVPVALRVIESIAHDEVGGDVETDVPNVH